MKKVVLLLIAICTIPSIAEENNSARLLALQHKYVGQKVDVKSEALHCLGEIATVQQITGRPVIATDKVNALGEVVSQDPLPGDTFLDVVVQCPDGFTAKAMYVESLLPSVISLVVDTTAIDAAARSRLQNQLGAFIGSSVFPEYGVKLFTFSSSMSELAKRSAVTGGYAYLDPLKVISGKLIDFERSTYAVLKLANSDGAVFLSCKRVLAPNLPPATSVIDDNLLASIGSFSALDLEAVRSGDPRRGMSRAALYAMWGIESKDNDYGASGHQLIYEMPDTEVMVYLSTDNIVTEVQKFPK